MLKFLFGIALILAIAWGIIWKEKVYLQEAFVNNYFKQIAEQNFATSFRLKTRGFPNRLDTQIENLNIVEKKNGGNLTIKSILLISLIYSHDQMILAIDPPIRLGLNDEILEVTNGKLKISIAETHAIRKPVFTFHGTDLYITLNTKDVITIKDLIIATRFSDSISPKNQEIFVKATGLHLTESEREKKNNLRNLNFNFNFKQLNNEFELNKIPFLDKVIFAQNSSISGTLKVINSNLNLPKDLESIKSLLGALKSFLKLQD